MPLPDIQILLTPQPPNILITLIGEIRLDSADCDKHIAAALANNPQNAIVDCSQLTFISSCGMKLLVNLRNHVHPHHGTVTLQNLKPHLLTAFRHAVLTDLFHFDPPL